MPTVSNCPECEEPVSLPQGVDPQARVQCPLCEAEYLLEDALKIAPPELILLDTPVPTPAAASANVWGDEETGDDASSASNLQTDVIELESPRPRSDDFGAALDFGGDFDEEPSAFDQEARKSEALRDIPAVAPLPKRKRRGGPVRQIVGIFGGGFFGLALGYYLLLWIGGPPKDFLKLGRRFPAWMVPAEFHPRKKSVAKEPLPADRSKQQLKVVFPDKTNKTDELTSEPGNLAVDHSNNETSKLPVEDLLHNDVSRDGPPNVNELDRKAAAVRFGPDISKTRTAAEFGKALKAAADARDELKAVGISSKKGQAYKKFCLLAETLTSLDDESTLGSQFRLRRNAVEDILLEVAQEPGALEDLKFIGKKWLENSNREHDGVLLVGTVRSVEQEGPGLLYSTVLGLDTGTITVVSEEKPRWKANDTAIVMGLIIEEPHEIKGYLGNANVAVWASMLVKPEL